MIPTRVAHTKATVSVWWIVKLMDANGDDRQGGPSYVDASGKSII